MTTHLIWFRCDLRLHNNLALTAAYRDRSTHILALYISAPEQWKAHDMVPRQAVLVDAQLNVLQTALAEESIPLLSHGVGDSAVSVETVENVCVQHGVSRMFYNYRYEVNERQRDAAIKKSLPQVMCEGFDNSVILPARAVMTGNYEIYKVFTPSGNAQLKQIKDEIPECVSAPKIRKSGALGSPLTSTTLSYPQQGSDSQQFPTEGKLAIAQLRHFYRQTVGEYGQLRDFPATDGTSRLSASLATGRLSPRQCLNQLLVEQPQALKSGADSIWLNELIWREFYCHPMTYRPTLCRYQPFIHWTDHV